MWLSNAARKAIMQNWHYCKMPAIKAVRYDTYNMLLLIYTKMSKDLCENLSG